MYTPVIKHSNGKSLFSIGNTSSKAPFSIAMLDYRSVYPETGPRNIPRQYSLLRMCFLYISLATIFSAYSHAFCPLNFTLGATSAANLSILVTPQIHSSVVHVSRKFHMPPLEARPLVTRKDSPCKTTMKH